MRKEFEVDRDAILAKVRNFLRHATKDTDIDPDVNMFESGLVDSLFAMQLLLYVEQEFGLKVTHEDLDPKNFNSLNALTNFVLRKQGVLA